MGMARVPPLVYSLAALRRGSGRLLLRLAGRPRRPHRGLSTRQLTTCQAAHRLRSDLRRRPREGSQNHARFAFQLLVSGQTDHHVGVIEPPEQGRRHHGIGLSITQRTARAQHQRSGLGDLAQLAGLARIPKRGGQNGSHEKCRGRGDSSPHCSSMNSHPAKFARPRPCFRPMPRAFRVRLRARL